MIPPKLPPFIQSQQPFLQQQQQPNLRPPPPPPRPEAWAHQPTPQQPPQMSMQQQQPLMQQQPSFQPPTFQGPPPRPPQLISPPIHQPQQQQPPPRGVPVLLMAANPPGPPQPVGNTIPGGPPPPRLDPPIAPVQEEDYFVPNARMPSDEDLVDAGIVPLEFHQTLEFVSSAGPRAVDMARNHERTNFPFLQPSQPTFTMFLSALKWKVLDGNQNSLPSEWYTFFQANKQYMRSTALQEIPRKRPASDIPNQQGFSIKDYKESFRRRYNY